VLKVTAPSGINLQKIDRRDHTLPMSARLRLSRRKAWGGSLAQRLTRASRDPAGRPKPSDGSKSWIAAP